MSDREQRVQYFRTTDGLTRLRVEPIVKGQIQDHDFVMIRRNGHLDVVMALAGHVLIHNRLMPLDARIEVIGTVIRQDGT